MTYTAEYLRADWGKRVARKTKWLHRITYFVYFVAFSNLVRNILVYLIEQLVNPVPELTLNSSWGGFLYFCLCIPIIIFPLHRISVRIMRWELERSQNDAYLELIIGQMRNLLIGIILLILSFLLSSVDLYG